MTLRIGICGPTGSGKSTLARALDALPDTGVVHEPRPTDLLRAFARDPETECLPLQAAIMRGRAAGAQLEAGKPRLVFDRTVDEDFRVFVALHHRNGFLTESQVATLATLAATAQSQAGSPDLYVVLTADKQLLRKRLSVVSAPQAVLDSLEDQLALYREWQASLVNKVLVEIDTTERSVGNLVEVARWIYDTASSATRRDLPSNESLSVWWRVGA